tara:strand:+ start:1224 stop:4181 length:2958 start_codon:yes stop_codon:yes gene_type:complete
MANPISTSIKGQLKSAAISTVSDKISSKVPKVNSQMISAALGGSDLKSAALGSFSSLGGAVSEAVSGAAGLLGSAQAKLGALNANAEELVGLANNPLKLIEKGKADLMGITGEEYGFTLDQYRELKDRSALPLDSVASAASKLPNPLRNHNGMNYEITLGVLSAAEFNNPESYRAGGGFKSYIIKSAGGMLGKRTQVFDETGGGQSDHAEYYIDDIELDAVISPNKNTRMTAGTALSFTVTEPHSMGNFIQAIIGAANEAGYSAYNEAPFCLKIDFNGWNLDGTTDANFQQQPCFIPIKFINMEFNITGQGSTYAVKAIPMSESGLSDNINNSNSQIRASGTFCHEVLETNDQSVTGAMNRQIQDLEETGALAPFDRYVICFPKTRGTLRNVLKTGSIDEAAFTTSPEEQEAERVGSGVTNPQLLRSYSPKIIKVSQPNKTYSILKSFAENKTLMNEIGLSPLNEDTNAGGNAREIDASAATNPETGLVETQNEAAQPADKARDFQFNQGQQLTSIIEKIVLQTTYAAEKSTEGAKNGMNKWFKIDTQVFIDESPLTEAQVGRKPKIYVYSIIPYEVDEAVSMAGNKRPKNTKGLREMAQKEYNYIYTGKNEDVLNFDINFNNAFLMTANADLGMNSAGQRDPNAGTNNASRNESDGGAVISLPETLGPQHGAEFQPRNAESAATHSNDIRKQIAEMFHDRITNMTIDMVTAEMEIMGDPYFIPQQTGNHAALNGSSPSITEDGTMNYLDQSVFCIVNFRTPFDYQIKGSTMEFPQIVPGFSGLFQIWAVVNKFAKGQFTQTLKMIRRKGQDDKETTGNSGLLTIDNDAALNKQTTQSDGTVGQSGTNSTDCMPAALTDDIRNAMPAVDDAVVQQNLAVEKAKEALLPTSSFDIVPLVQGVDYGVAKVPDLTKIISSTTSSSPFADAFGDYTGSAGLTNAADNIRELQATYANKAQAAATSAVNNSIESATGAVKSKAKNLLGGF